MTSQSCEFIERCIEKFNELELDYTEIKIPLDYEYIDAQ